MRVLLLLSWIAASASSLRAQSQFNPRDDQYRALGLVRAKAELERTKAHAMRTVELASKGMATESDRQDRWAEYERSRVDFAQQLLAVASTDGHVTVLRAVKERLSMGQSRVRLTLSSLPLREAKQLKEILSDEALAALLPRGGVSDVIVSLKDASGANGVTIARPYERMIDNVTERPTTVSFDLLREADDIVISMVYGGRIEERRVLLEQPAGTGAHSWRVEQFAQTADLGTETVYGMVLERMADDARPIRLMVLGLPPEIDHEFRDPETKATLTQLQFQPGQLSRRLQLALKLPLRPSDALIIDRPIRFAAVAESQGAAGARVASRSETAMEITPRGLASAELRMDNLLLSARIGERVDAVMRLRNTGARTLHAVRVAPELPAGWTFETKPGAIPALQPGDERTVSLTMTSGSQVMPGDYEAALRVTGSELDEGRAPVRVLRVRLSQPSSGPWLLAVVVCVLVVIGTYSIRAVRMAAR